MIACSSLGKRYGEFPALTDLNLTIPEGQIFGFLGPNGAGKTTTMKLLMGFLLPSTGSARISGLDCHRDRIAVKSKVGYLPDVPTFMEMLRGREILQLAGELHGMKRPVARDRAAELMTLFGLEEARNEFASNYSLGMKKRLGLATALVHDPEVLILDEPINGLDPIASKLIKDWIQLSSREGRTILLSTHLLDMAEKICTRVGVLHKGLLVYEGPVGTDLEERFFTLTSQE